MRRVLAFALVCALGRAAYAQQTGTAEPPPVTIIKPSVRHDPGALYPRKAIDDGVRERMEVVLALDIDQTGKVTNVRVETGAGHGFDEAALEAARGLTFDPATRDGKPVASKMLHRYLFDPPPGRFVGRVLTPRGKPQAGATVTLRGKDGVEHVARTDATGAFAVEALPADTYAVRVEVTTGEKTTAEQAIAPADEITNVFRVGPAEKDTSEDVEEVVVRGVRPAREVTKRTLEQRELLRSPGTNGDALRGLVNLPGIARPPGFAGLLIVRGSAPQDTSIFVDGTLIPLVYHFGGLSSVVPTEMLSKLDFYPGNFSTQYGRAMGGIVEVGIKEPQTEKKLKGLAQADLIDARVMAEGPIPIGKGWSFAVAGRRSYVDLWLKPILEAAGTSVTAAPVYYDWQMLVKKEIDSHSTARLLFFGSDDRLELLVKNTSASGPGAGGDLNAHTGFWRFQARLENRLSKTDMLRITAAVGEDLIDFSFADLYFKIRAFPVTFRAELSSKISKAITFNTGFDEIAAPIDVEVRAPPPTPLGQPPPGPLLLRPPRTVTNNQAIHRPAVYSELEIVPWKGARLVPGIRLDYARDTGTSDLSPRVNFRQNVGPEHPRTTLKTGVGIFAQPPLPQQSNPIFGQLGLTSSRAVHYSLGIEREFGKNVEISVEGFYKQLDRLITSGAGNDGFGNVIGLETLIRYKPDKHFFGWVAYTLSRSVRNDAPYLPEHVAPFDQTHILTILGSYRFDYGWELGARFRLVSGNPYTPAVYGFYDANAATYLPLLGFPVNSERLPTFHQLDIRVDKTWTFKAWKFGIYADVVNVYNQGNVEAIQYNYNSTKQTYVTGLPFLPSLGMRGEL
jgi:TonB family protein